ncbi:MAG: hypothetical protein KDJ19_01370 [Hyphomicrobiaceae bacterium]|nr:hypothetical protein [Hyphomicrobiaceae bacterium]
MFGTKMPARRSRLNDFWRLFAGLLLAAGFLCVQAGGALAADFAKISSEGMEGYGRLILKFPERLDLPKYNLDAENNVLTVEFVDPIDLTLPDLAETMPGYLTVARIDPDKRGLRIGLLNDYQVHTIVAGEQLFIDLLPPDWTGLPPSLPPEVVAELARRAQDAAALAEQQRIIALARARNPTGHLDVGLNPTFIRLAFTWSEDTTAKFEREGDQLAVTFAWPNEVDLFALTENLPAEVTDVQSSSTIDSDTVRISLAEGVTARFFEESAKRFVIDIDRLEPQSEAPTAEQLLQAAVDEQERLRIEAESNGVADIMADGPVPLPETDQQEVIPKVTDVGKAIRIQFGFDAETPAAVFRRGDYLWLIFDSPAVVQAPDNPELLAAVAEDYSAIATGDTQIVRLKVSDRLMVSLGSQGAGWVLSLGDLSVAPNEPIQLNRRQDVEGREELAANLGDPARLHDVRDPEVGDILRVVTMYPPARGIFRDLTFVDFDVLGSIQGLVLRAKNPDLQIELSRHEATLSAPRGLTLSPALLARSRSPNGQTDGSRAAFVNLVDFEESNPKRLNSRLIELQNMAASGEGREQEQARLDLATAYLANRLPQEAIGVLAVLESDGAVENIVKAAEMVQAAADVAAGRNAEAIALLASDDLVNRPDAIMWRTIVRNATEDFQGAHNDALAAEAIIDSYPLWVQTEFLISGVTAAVEVQDLELARRLSTRLTQLELGHEDYTRLELLQGRIDELERRFDEALDTYGQVIIADVRPTRAEAIYRTIDLLNRIGNIDKERAAQVLSTETIVWRGGPLEAKMLELLANLQFASDDFQGAFATVREAADAGVDSDKVLELTAKAQKVFADLFLNGAADQLDPIEALTLFYTYRQLTPAGTRGDEMIRNLARRLVGVDLLDQAASLLEYQIENRLSGAARAQIAADLAIIQIANRAPDKALDVLARTSMANLAPSLERQRRILEARAFIDAGRAQLALDILNNLDGRDAESLRIEAYWKDKRYRDASEQIEFVYSRDGVPETLGLAARRQILRAAVGFVLANDRVGLARLRNKFSPAMESTPEWPLFDFVTGLVTQSSADFRQLASEVASTDTLSAFLQTYRETYEGDGALVPMHAGVEAS